MRPQIEVYKEHIKGDTYCVVTGSSRIPLYHLDKNNVVLMDSGLKGPDTNGLLKLLDKENLHVRAVLTSHFHYDHTGGHMDLRAKYGSKIYMSLYDAAASSNYLNLKPVVLSASYRDFLRTKQRIIPTDQLFSHRDKSVEVDGVEFELLPLPGHAPEHTGFVTPDGIAYLGDAILSENILRKVHMPYCLHCQESLDTKRKIQNMKYDGYIMAHNGVADQIYDLAQWNIDNQMEKVEETASVIDHFMTMEQVVAAVVIKLGVDDGSVKKIWSANHNVTAVMEYLIDAGRVVYRANNGFIEYIRKDCL